MRVRVGAVCKRSEAARRERGKGEQRGGGEGGDERRGSEGTRQRGSGGAGVELGGGRYCASSPHRHTWLVTCLVTCLVTVGWRVPCLVVAGDVVVARGDVCHDLGKGGGSFRIRGRLPRSGAGTPRGGTPAGGGGGGGGRGA